MIVPCGNHQNDEPLPVLMGDFTSQPEEKYFKGVKNDEVLLSRCIVGSSILFQGCDNLAGDSGRTHAASTRKHKP